MSKAAKSGVFCCLLTLGFAALGCSGAPVKVDTESGADVEQEPEEEAPVLTEPTEQMEVSGLLGTIPPESVERAVRKKEDSLARCYGEALEDLEEIEGSLDLAIEVAHDGSVSQAYLSAGDLGSLVAEECIIEVMERMKFPKPSGGGRAIVSYPLELPAPYDHPKPHNWNGSRATSVISENSADLERCLAGATGITLTFYAVKGGRVIAAGGTAAEFENYEKAQCLARAALEWSVPDPGERPAKAVISF